MGGVRAQQKLDLQPDRVIYPDVFTVVIIVLQPHLGKLARVPSQVRGYPPTSPTIGIKPKCVLVLARTSLCQVVTSDRRDPPFVKTVCHLRVHAPFCVCFPWFCFCLFVCV